MPKLYYKFMYVVESDQRKRFYENVYKPFTCDVTQIIYFKLD